MKRKKQDTFLIFKIFWYLSITCISIASLLSLSGVGTNKEGFGFYQEECISSHITGDVFFYWEYSNKSSFIPRKVVDRDLKFYLGNETYGAKRYVHNIETVCDKYALVRNVEREE